MPPRHGAVTGTGWHAPGEPVPNGFFNERYGMDVDSFLRETRHIRRRHFMGPDQATSDLVVPAARQALAEAGLSPTDLDLIIVSTDTPDYISPSTAAVVQHKLGATGAGTFDVNTACAGFVTGLDMAHKYIAADSRYRHVLVAGAYGMSKYLDWDDHKIATLFADGAGAAVISASEDESGVLGSTLWADGSFHDFMGIYAGGTHMPITAEVLARKDHLLRFTRKFPSDFNATHWPRIIGELLARLDLRPADADLFFFTQINIASINESLDALGVPHDRSFNVMDRFAYTGSACIPMALGVAADEHRLRRGDLVVFMGSGGGVAMAAAALRWGYDT